MTDRLSIIEAALSIRPELHSIPDVPEHMSTQLDCLLLRFCKQEAVEDDIWDLLTDTKATRMWVTQFDRPRQVHKGGQNLAGDPSNISASVFKCPRCDYTWSRHRIGEKVPYCRDHDVILEPV